MGVSLIQEQRDVIVNTIKSITQGDWKVLILDEESRKIVDNVLKEDDILNHNIANIERIEEKRPISRDMDAIYLLSAQPHIVDCLMADFERRRYRKTFLVWTALLDPQLRRRIDSSQSAQEQLGGFETLSIDYFPRESHLVTFRDPWSFPILYHPSCNNLVARHMLSLAQKITGICVSLGEHPKIRYYAPRQATHEANVLCGHLARFVQGELDAYAKWNPKFPPQSIRPQGMLIITDRSMDLITPLVHEFTYQAMAHDLLRIKEGDKVLYRAIVNEGSPDAQEKDMEITEKDEIWVKNRHSHMKDTIERLMGDFQKFTAENPHFTNQNANAASLNVIKDMLAGLPQFQESKEAYTLHLSMAQECMNTFQQRKLPDIASVEQSLATGLDEGYRKPKNLADQVVRLLDDESVIPADRLRLIMLYILYRDGVIPEDIQRLLAHSSLPPQDAEVVSNLDLLGARSTKALKENRPSPAPLFPRKTSSTAASEGYALSRFEPALKMLLEEVSKGILDQSIFPYTRPPLDNSEADMYNASQASLRSAKPTWAQNRRSMHESKQRIIVFMAGGATYSESRACYEVSRNSGKDIFLATSEMLTPALFVRQIADLSLDRRRLNLPSDRPRPKAPAHLFEREERTPVPTPPTVPAKPMAPRRIPDPTSNQAPIAGLGNMTLDPGGSGNSRPSNGAHSAELGYGRGKLEKKKESEEKKHKKRNFFGIR